MSENQKPILVVDDDDDARTLLCMMLKNIGHETIDFNSGVAALKDTSKLDVSIAMLDIMMPEMNGYELLAELKKLDSFADTPVVMVTAKDQDDDIVKGYQQGADYYITKPYTMSQIKYALDLYLES